MMLPAGLIAPAFPHYCEYVFWHHPDQPLNVYSHVAMIFVAGLVFGQRRDLPRGAGWILTFLLFLIATCGVLWHSDMNALILEADIAVSAALVATLVFLVLRFVFYWPLWMCLPAVPVLLLLCAVMRLDSMWIAPDALPLLPLMALLLGSGLWSAVARRSNAGLYLMISAFWLAGGFLVLSLDLPACEAGIKTGTHFIWHVLAAVAAWCVIRGIAVADIDLLDRYRDRQRAALQAPVPTVVPFAEDAATLYDGEDNAAT